MLRLILSPSVGGTAGYLYDTAASIASSGGEAVLIVPEQYSFAAERIVLERLGTADAQRVEVLSFTRLANTVFNAVGWDKGKRLNEAGKILLMSRALEQCADKLNVYSRSADSPAVVREPQRGVLPVRDISGGYDRRHEQHGRRAAEKQARRYFARFLGL